jgi:hypothetical protein
MVRPVGGERNWGDGIDNDGLTLGGAAMGCMIMAFAEPTTVRVSAPPALSNTRFEGLKLEQQRTRKA